jgi:hypothetical protein
MRAGDITKYDFIQHPGAKFPVADSGRFIAFSERVGTPMGN